MLYMPQLTAVPATHATSRQDQLARDVQYNEDVQHRQVLLLIHVSFTAALVMLLRLRITPQSCPDSGQHAVPAWKETLSLL